MFETHNSARRAEVMALTGMQALQLYKASPRSRESGANEGETQGSAGASLTMAQAQRVLDDLVEEGWFDKSPKGFLSLSPRALMELRGWLIDTYNEPPNPEDSDDEGVERIKMCEACREIVTVVSSLQLQCLANWEIGIAQLLTFCFFFLRANGAPTVTAAADCMMPVFVSSSVPFRRRSAPSASPNGRNRTLWASAPQNRRAAQALPQLLLRQEEPPWPTKIIRSKLEQVQVKVHKSEGYDGIGEKRYFSGNEMIPIDIKELAV